MFMGCQDAEELTQNMVDAGCTEEMITCFMSCLQKGDKSGGLCLLEEQRQELLHEIHGEQSCIEFLDEQLYNLRGKIK